MTFQPRMTSVREGVSVIGELKWRSWNGVVADLWNARCASGARGEYISKDPRLFILLDSVGGDLDACLSPRGEARSSARCRTPICYVPADVPLWGGARDATRIRHLDLHFDPVALSERLGEDLAQDQLATPQIMFADERILGLARLIADECANPGGRHDLYGDGLTTALLIDLLRLGQKKERARTPLASWQLKRVTDFIQANCARSIRLQELADMVELSQSYFSHAFKASTGLPPHQWAMNARIRKVQDMLLRGEMALTEIAAETGFSDQAHFTRVFRRIVGDTPAAWQRAHRA
ncbi:helix-turn-helix domain-containing protein [Flaviflagellibacter deserti]|uniref:Helix-turn-helix domain-containing protein n=1 Tax=Flaviflagellibacter deserti TaxID=2267266 RepID=A0ABV9Z2V2_9HYPH